MIRLHDQMFRKDTWVREMKQSMRTYLLKILMFLTMVLSMAGFAYAAGAPAKVKTLKASGAESTVKLKWSKVSGAKGYFVYSQSESGAMTKIATVKGGSKNSYKVKNLKNDTSYSFCVSAWKKSGKDILEGEKSGIQTVVPKADNPGKVKLKLYANQDSKVVISWKKLKKATGYEVFQKDSSGAFVSIAKVSDTYATVTGLTNGKTCQFKVRAMRTVNGGTTYGALSNAVTGKPMKQKEMPASLSNVHKVYYGAKIVKAGKGITLVSTDGKSTVTLKNGTSVIVTVNQKPLATILYQNNYYQIKRANVALRSLKYDTKNTYNKETAEAFANYKGYKSTSKYFIWISTYTQRMYVFKGSQYNWNLLYTWKVSTGKFGHESVSGISYLGAKMYKWWFGSNQFAWYASVIRGGAIHSELYYPSGNRYVDMGRLGHPASHGCVRLYKTNAKFIYDHVPGNTTVLVF